MARFHRPQNHWARGRTVSAAAACALLYLGLVGASCSPKRETSPQPAPLSEPTKQTESGHFKATFAGGCFWCMEPPFEKLDGVASVVSGYAGGHLPNPSYSQVSNGGTGHAEAIQVTYDPERITYRQLLDVFWHNIDPTVKDRQFCDVGTQYRSVIFVHDQEQRKLAVTSKEALANSSRFSGRMVYTEVKPATRFYPAETYHQDFYKKNPDRYHAYRRGCGRDRRLREIWGKDAPPGRVEPVGLSS